MTDYELYQILEENGYKPHEKNLQILKEGLESGRYEILNESKKLARVEKEILAGGNKDAILQANNISPKRYETYTQGKAAARSIANNNPEEARSQILSGKIKKTRTLLPPLNSQEPLKKDDTGAHKTKESRMTTRKLVTKLIGKQKVEDQDLKEEYSDYELYQILKNSGYKTHERNLQILKEGLSSGNYEILDETKYINKYDIAQPSYAGASRHTKKEIEEIKKTGSRVANDLEQNEHPDNLKVVTGGITTTRGRGKFHSAAVGREAAKRISKIKRERREPTATEKAEIEHLIKIGKDIKDYTPSEYSSWEKAALERHRRRMPRKLTGNRRTARTIVNKIFKKDKKDDDK